MDLDKSYSMFVDSLCKELHAIVDNKDKKVFITHVWGLRCVLTCNIADNSIVVIGQGHRLWKETAFICLTRGLKRNFTTEMDKELSDEQTSTPVRKNLCDALSGFSPVLSGNDSNNEQLLSVLNDIKRQISSLQQVA